MELVFKILSISEWDEAVKSGRFEGSPDDRRDGFIHLSASHQLQGTAAKHFAGKPDLVLAAFLEGDLSPHLKWEVSRGGDLFPHLYGPLPVGQAVWVKPLPMRDGRHQFPEEAGK